MRRPMYAFFTIAAFLLNACGKDFTPKNQMSQDAALATLNSFAAENDRSLRRGNSTNVDELVRIITTMVERGQIKVPANGHNALGKVDLSGLSQIFSVLGNGGKIGSLLQLASGLVNANGGDGTKAKLNLNGILAILQQVMPLIAGIAPQFSGLIQAATAILPIVLQLMNMFKKAPASAMNSGMSPVLA